MTQGTLYRQDSGRYAIDNDVRYELTCGAALEVLVDGKWQRTTVEATNREYYLTNGSPIEGAIVRVDY